MQVLPGPQGELAQMGHKGGVISPSGAMGVDTPHRENEIRFEY